MNQKYLFYMPEDEEAFLCALCAIQALVIEGKKRKILPHVTVVCPNGETVFLAQALNPDDKDRPHAIAGLDIVPDGLITPVRDYDLVFKFDMELALKAGAVTSKHLAQMFCIQLGSPAQILPFLDCFHNDTVADALFLYWQRSCEVAELVDTNKDCKLVVVGKDEKLTLLDRLRLVSKSAIVVGVRSFETYAAAALGKGVIEISPPSKGYRSLLSKWSHSGYQMIYMEPEQVSAPLVYRSLESIWRRFVQDKSTQMEPSVYTAQSAKSI